MKTIITILIFTLAMVSSTFAGDIDIVGSHALSNERGLVIVNSVEGNKMAFDAIYAPVNGKLVILTDVFADYDSQTQKAIYSEDRLCPDALKMTFQNNGKVVLQEATCADF
jgi:hypothetical protein